MPRKIAVIVTDRQGEALRMTLGLTLADDAIDLFLLDKKFEWTEADSTNIELIREMDVEIYSNIPENEEIKYVDTQEVARMLTQYDHVISY